MNLRCSNRRNHALTLFEVLIVIGVLAFLAMLLMPSLAINKKRPLKYTCINNLKQIGLAEKIWAGDNGDKYPYEISVTNGGAMEYILAGDVCFYFSVISNELSVPKILTCPEDPAHQPPATVFSTPLSNHISYFVGLQNDSDPQGLLSGDDNFVIHGAPIKSGAYELLTNTPVRWASTRHNRYGNILLADGSVQLFSDSDLLRQLEQDSLTTNRIIIP